MILTDDDLEERLASPKNLVNVIHVKPGRTEGAGNVPSCVRELLGVMGREGVDSQTDIAKAFGVDPSSVSNYAKGLVGSSFDPDLAENVKTIADKRIEDRQDEARSLALDSLMTALGHIGERLPEEGKLIPITKLGKLATDMSRVVGVLKDKEDNTTINNTRVVLFMPTQKRTKDYDVIDA